MDVDKAGGERGTEKEKRTVTSCNPTKGEKGEKEKKKNIRCAFWEGMLHVWQHRVHCKPSGLPSLNGRKAEDKPKKPLPGKFGGNSW